jgi:type IV pilus assembly protein PilB
LGEQDIPREVLQLIPFEIAENYQLVAYERRSNDVSVAMVNPANFKAIEAVEFMARESGWKPHYFITNAEGLAAAFKQYGSLTSEVKEALTQAEGKFQDVPGGKFTGLEEAGGKLEEVVKTAPVAKMVAVIFRHAVEGGASDIHIEPVEDETRVRYRIDGVLHTSIVLPRYIHSAIVSRIKVLANLKIDETRLPQDGRIRLTIAGRTIDFRVSTLPLFNTEKVVLRILDSSSGVKTFEELGFWGKVLKAIQENIKKSHGMFLVTGPTGSGKSTSLYAALNVLNQEGVNIITLEDPIEYYLEGVNQSQINPEIGLTFASGLRSILRQDPDIIMVGEIRDSETAELGIHASLTGHIVLSTLHTNDAFGTLPRLLDMKIEPFLLASTINIIIAQRLVRKICKYCTKDFTPPVEMVERVRASLTDIPDDYKSIVPKEPWVFKRGEGCNRCDFTGYKGRTVMAEALMNTQALQQIIIAGANPAAVRTEFKNQGMLTMEQDGLLKVLQGVTTIEEVFTATND